MLRLSEQILFLLVWGGEFLGELGDLLEWPQEWGKILAKNDRAVKRALARLVKSGAITKSGKRVKAKYKVTKLGRVKALESRPFLAKREWRGKWLAVVFDIPERYRGIRSVLRRFLRSMGFVNFQRSLWLTPFGVRREVLAFLKASRLDEMAYLMEVAKVHGVEPKEFAYRGWGLEALAKRYSDFAKECSDADKATFAMRQKFVKLVFADPMLPDKLMPKDFPRGRAILEYKKLIARNTQIIQRIG